MCSQGVLASELVIRAANIDDVNALVALENSCFDSDRLSLRQFKYWLKADHKLMYIAKVKEDLVAYALVILRKGTSLARLYSLAVSPLYQGQGIAAQLLQLLEKESVKQQRAYLRLEVSENNTKAIALYKRLGYKKFGFYPHYYQDNSNALRMQKPVLQKENAKTLGSYPYYIQTTEFTCGPAALLMAMANLNPDIALKQSAELDIWRTATTIFMTSGHGGTHPLGLGIAAVNNGFSAEVYINQAVPLFLAGVRQTHKKSVITQVENDFVDKAKRAGVVVQYQDYSTQDILDALQSGASVLCLLSSYQFDGYKGPHWVVVTHMDEYFMYIHDSDVDIDKNDDLLRYSEETELFIEEGNDSTYRQHVPLSLTNFERYTRFGKAKLRTAIIIRFTDNK